MPASPIASSPATRSLAERVRERVRRATRIVRRIIGAPDYETYLAHMRAHYPGCTPVDRQTFANERYLAKYTQPGQRCC